MAEEIATDKLEIAPKVNRSVLDAFNSLKAVKDSEKLNGGAKIISQLQNSENAKDIQYALKRLVRSLGANVPDMRAGYFATLVTLLKKFDIIIISDLLDLMKKELHANNSSKSEVGDVALGQILVCGALFRSGRMLQCPEHEQKAVIELLLNASKKKSYLSTVAHLILLDLVNGLNEEQFLSIVWSYMKPELKKGIKEHSLDSLHFLMVANNKFPNKVKLRKLIGVPEILCEDNVNAICDKLMTGIDFNSVSHPIYKEISTQIAKSPHLKLFWTCIDSHLVKHNRNRELAAINILSTILNNVEDNVDIIPELISTNFLKLFMDWFKGLQTASKIRSKRDNEDDNKIMIKKQKELLNCLAKVLKSEKVTYTVRIDVLKKLLFNPGEINFTEVTGTAIVKSLISDLDKNGVKKMAKLFKGVLLNTSKKFVKKDVERNWYNNERVKAAELLSYLVTHETVKDDTEFKLIYMKLLMCFGFFKIGGDNNVAVSADLSGAIKSCFYRCFTSRFSNVDSLVTVLSSLCGFVCSILEKEQIRAKIDKQFPKESMECWEMLTEVCRTIERGDSKSKVDNVFLVLLYQLGLFLFSEPTHVKVSRSSIKELKSCYEHYRKGRKKKLGKVQENLSDDPEWIEVLVEVLLSILSVESSVLRSVVQCVFRLMWEFLTPSAIGQIISVLDPESESDPLTQDSESENDSNDEEEDEEENSDEKGSDSDEHKSDIEEDDDKDEEMKIPEQLRLAVQKALGAAAPESDTESVDADMIDEEEGKKLDEALAEAFKQFHHGKGKNSKKERKNKKALSDFRIRVLDLIDIYLEKDPGMDICLGMIAPLMRCLEFCIRDNQFSELENRTRKTIKTLTKIKKFASTDDVTLDTLCDYLKSTIDKGERSHFLFQAVGDVITYFAIFIIHCSQKLGNKSTVTPKKNKSASPLLEIFKEALQNYFKNRSCLLPIIFFHNVLQADWDGSYDLIPVITENIFNQEVRQFRRNEGIELLIGFYRTLKRNKPTTEKDLNTLSKVEMDFEKTSLKVLLGPPTYEAKNNFFVLLKKLINTIQHFHQNCHIESSLDFESLLRALETCKGMNKTKENHSVPTAQNLQNGKGEKKNKKKRKAQKMNGNEGPRYKKLKNNSSQSE